MRPHSFTICLTGKTEGRGFGKIISFVTELMWSKAGDTLLYRRDNFPSKGVWYPIDRTIDGLWHLDGAFYDTLAIGISQEDPCL